MFRRFEYLSSGNLLHLQFLSPVVGWVPNFQRLQQPVAGLQNISGSEDVFEYLIIGRYNRIEYCTDGNTTVYSNSKLNFENPIKYNETKKPLKVPVKPNLIQQNIPRGGIHGKKEGIKFVI